MSEVQPCHCPDNGIVREPTNYRPPELKYKKNDYPQSANPVLSRQYFCAIFCAPKGVGKTFSATEMLKAFQDSPPLNKDGTKRDCRIIVISPTYDQQECMRALKIDENDVYKTYSDDTIREIMDDLKHEKEETEKYQKQLRLFKKFQKIKSERALDKFSPEELFELEANDFEEPEPPRFKNGCDNFIVVDDMLGTSIFKGSGKNPFTQLLLNSRHYACNILIMSQHLKAIPRAIRGNISLWWIGKFGTRSILPDLYHEVASAVCSEDEFYQMYDTATNEPYGALVVDFTKPKEKRFSISFREYIRCSK